MVTFLDLNSKLVKYVISQQDKTFIYFIYEWKTRNWMPVDDYHGTKAFKVIIVNRYQS